MNTELRQKLYLIADEIRGMATIEDFFADNPYIIERAETMMKLAAKVAAMAEDEYSEDEMIALFDKRPWFRISPAIGVDAAVFNKTGEILLIRRKDNDTWAMPGGIAEIGDTLPETAIKELWEEAGLRGRVVRQLGTFDGRLWGSISPVHLINMVFLVECDELNPTPGLETTDAQFFARDALPFDNMHLNHIGRIPKVFETLENGCYFDPIDSYEMDFSTVQRTED
jgi:ADP-ribose pyrophosphatase YjhB (NUDIX family)